MCSEVKGKLSLLPVNIKQAQQSQKYDTKAECEELGSCTYEATDKLK